MKIAIRPGVVDSWQSLPASVTWKGFQCRNGGEHNVPDTVMLIYNTTDEFRKE